MSYEITNISRIPLYEDLETKDVHGKRQQLILGVRQKAVLSDDQWKSHSVQTHLKKKRLRSKKV